MAQNFSSIRIRIRENKMNNTVAAETRTSRGYRRMRAVLTVTAAVLVHQITICDSFTPTTSTTRSHISKSTTTLSFRNLSENSSANAFFGNDRFATTSPVSATTSTRMEKRVGLPTWLSVESGHLKDANMKKLRNFMGASYFTVKEIRILTGAIEEAAAGDAHKIAGAAEFCLLIAETMEMGLDALTAAAFHYCACVAAREQAALSSESTSGSNNKITLTHHSNIHSYGTEVSEIEADAARLKQLELVAASVFAQSEGHAGRVTPDKNDAENLRHLLLTETKDWRALAIRSAACLYRLRGLLKVDQPDLTREAVRTAREALSIYSPLASRMGMHRLKNELEGAAFRILYRRQYEAVTCQSNSKLAEAMQHVLEKVKSDVTQILESDHEFQNQVADFSVSARVKEPYSMWKKMLRLGYNHVLQVPDALALRVVLDAKQLSPNEPKEVTQARERALCYYAQKLCQQEYRPLEANPRFKDYIANPKRNGYQSLHYTGSTHWEGEDWTLEVQVRSSEMHSVAEFGLASHFDYKAQQKKNPVTSSSSVEKEGGDVDKSSDAYTRNLQKWRWQQHGGKMEMHPEEWDALPVFTSDMWHTQSREKRIRARAERLKPYLEALTDAQSDLARDKVFVFLTQQLDNSEGSCPISAEGKVLALPAGACVLDALREGERTLGLQVLRNQGFALNGLKTTVTRQLQNGDILGVHCSVNRNTVMA